MINGGISKKGDNSRSKGSRAIKEKRTFLTFFSDCKVPTAINLGGGG